MMEEKKIIRCRRCGVKLGYGDYIGDYYGLCEDGCEEDALGKFRS